MQQMYEQALQYEELNPDFFLEEGNCFYYADKDLIPLRLDSRGARTGVRVQFRSKFKPNIRYKLDLFCLSRSKAATKWAAYPLPSMLLYNERKGKT